MTEGERKPPFWLAIVAIIATVWALAGVYACYTQLTLSSSQLAALPAAQRDAFSTMPLVIRLAYVLATAGGLGGAALLLARRRLAREAFMASFVGIVIQFGWVFLVFGGVTRLGPTALIFPGFVAAVCAGEIALAHMAGRRGWLG